MDFRDQALMTATPKLWHKYEIIHDERLEKRLGVEEFRIHKDLECGEGVPFVRFPGWYFCPKCKKLQHISKWDKQYRDSKNDIDKIMIRPMCTSCKISIIPVSILTVCKNGHIDDFPWVEWIHRRKGNICDSPKLKIVSNSGTLGLEGFKVECIECGASSSLKGAFAKDVFENIKGNLKERFKCKGKMPWKGTKENCMETPRAILRNASNIYFPKIESSIVIPPYSDELNTKIEECNEYRAFINAKGKSEKKGKLDRFLSEDLEDYIEEIAKEIGEENNIYAIRKIVERKIYNKDKNLGEDISDRNSYRAEEYDALLGMIDESSFKSRDFRIEKKDIEEYDIQEIKNVTLVKRLREVRALVGYTRIKPPLSYIMGTNKSGDESKVVDIKEDDDKWYPAYEVRGEGIFIELNSKLINDWVNKNNEIRERASKINKRYNNNKSEELKREITPKFLLLHTLAHILIKELSFECGYSATSLRERIYCNLPKEEKDMSGILIYTAAGDSEGSLGGLVKQGNPEFLPRIIINAINRAKWCSADPVCGNSIGQGRNSLNLASCHNCTLLPETSCEEFNTLLDRCMVVGKIDNKDLGFFSRYI